MLVKGLKVGRLTQVVFLGVRMNVIHEIFEKVKSRDPDQPEFHQAVREVLESLEPVLERHPEFVEAGIVERIVEPERLIHFRVPWVDDNGVTQTNRGFRTVSYTHLTLPTKA